MAGTLPTQHQQPRLVATRDVLPPALCAIHPFPHFNQMQSLLVEEVYRTNENITLAAPTGSGKTAIMEVAIARFVESTGLGSSVHESSDRHCVYLAPSKALCQQKAIEWSRKFAPLGHNVLELTGDVDVQDCLQELSKASIIVTTPEKWDSVTRSWRDHVHLLGSVDLLLVDEVHHLNEERGSVLEIVIVRMRFISNFLHKARGQSTEGKSPLRIVALSATLPNITDIGEWLGCQPRHIHYFDDSFRPVPLQVHTFTYGHAANPYLFDKSLDKKVGELIHRYSEQQQSLVFCTSKKSTETLAADLVKDRRLTSLLSTDARANAQLIVNQSLRALVLQGVAFHHAGLPAGDRLIVEQLFLRGEVRLLCATSTLAYGVNLPAHLVIIKGTHCWRGSTKGYENIPWSDIIQMVGRAGRPGFDRFGVAVIMTNEENVNLYRNFHCNAGIVKSKLPFIVHEAINAEIAQRVISCFKDVVEWLRSTFFYVCLCRNRFSKEELQSFADKEVVRALKADGTPEQAIENISLRVIEDLLSAGLIREQPADVADALRSKSEAKVITPLPKSLIMSRNLTKFTSMKTLLNIPHHTTFSQFILILAKCTELQRPVRRSDKRLLNEMMQSIRFPVKSRVQQPDQKAFVLLQAAVSRLPIKDFSLKVEQAEMVDNAMRLLKAAQDLAIDNEFGGCRLEYAILLERALKTRLWEYPRPNIFLQCRNLSLAVAERIPQRPEMSNFLSIFGMPSQRLVEDLACTAEEANHIQHFVRDLAHAMLSLQFSVFAQSIRIVIKPALHIDQRQYNSTITYQLVCYDVSTMRLLCYRALPAGTLETTFDVSLARAVWGVLAAENVRCCLFSNVVGLDTIVGASVQSEVANKEPAKTKKALHSKQSRDSTMQPAGQATQPTIVQTQSNTIASAHQQQGPPGADVTSTAEQTALQTDHGKQSGVVSRARRLSSPKPKLQSKQRSDHESNQWIKKERPIPTSRFFDISDDDNGDNDQGCSAVGKSVHGPPLLVRDDPSLSTLTDNDLLSLISFEEMQDTSIKPQDAENIGKAESNRGQSASSGSSSKSVTSIPMKLHAMEARMENRLRQQSTDDHHITCDLQAVKRLRRDRTPLSLQEEEHSAGPSSTAHITTMPSGKFSSTTFSRHRSLHPAPVRQVTPPPQESTQGKQKRFEEFHYRGEERVTNPPMRFPPMKLESASRQLSTQSALIPPSSQLQLNNIPDKVMSHIHSDHRDLHPVSRIHNPRSDSLRSTHDSSLDADFCDAFF